jgi:hypothetical protein
MRREMPKKRRKAQVWERSGGKGVEDRRVRRKGFGPDLAHLAYGPVWRGVIFTQ